MQWIIQNFVDSQWDVYQKEIHTAAGSWSNVNFYRKMVQEQRKFDNHYWCSRSNADLELLFLYNSVSCILDCVIRADSDLLRQDLCYAMRFFPQIRSPLFSCERYRKDYKDFLHNQRTTSISIWVTYSNGNDGEFAFQRAEDEQIELNSIV